jgi:hypothetical protein
MSTDFSLPFGTVWPLLAFVALLLFRRELGRAIEHLQSIRFSNVRVKFHPKNVCRGVGKKMTS